MKYKKILSFLVAIAMVLATFTAFSTVTAVEGDMDPSVVLYKTADFLDNGKVEITLETYATAEYTSYAELPDIIFCLDTSPSMEETVPGTGADPLDPSDDLTRFQVLKNSVIYILDYIMLNNISVNVAFTQFSDNNVTGLYYKDYINLSAEPNLYYDGYNNYSVMYDSNAQYSNSYVTKNLFFALGQGEEADAAYDIVNNLAIDDYGVSRADKGLNAVLQIVENPNVIGEDSITILYTDGLPGQSSSEFKDSTNKFKQTYDNSQFVKSVEATDNKIYAMTLDGPDVYSNANFPDPYGDGKNISRWEFAEVISSNYDATTNTTPYDQYAYVFSNENFDDELIAAFETIIQENIEGPDYGVTTQVRDYLTEVIMTPEVSDIGLANASTDGDSVRVYTSAFTGIFDEGLPTEEYTFNPTYTELDPGDVTLVVDGTNNGVYVSGFDYSENLCYTDYEEIDHGMKLIIVITTDLIPGFIGGNMVETNETNSGFYLDSDSSYPINRFEVPTIDVPLQYVVTPVDKKVYITNGACGIEVLADIVAGVVNYSQNDPGEGFYYPVPDDYTLGGHRNDYVDVSYAFYDGDPDGGGTHLGTLTIDAGTTTIDGSVSGFTQLLDTKTVTVRVTVTPIYSGTITPNPLTFDIYPEIIVIDSTINLQNSINFLGEVPEYEDFVDSVYWPPIADADYIGCDGTTPLAAATGMPDLLITPVDDSWVPFDGDYDVIGSPILGHAKVMADLPTDVDITSRAAYHNEDIPSDLNEFYLTIVDGEFTIYKTSTEYSSLDPIESNQGFKFMIEQFEGENIDDPVGAKVRTFYVTLDNAQDAKTIKYLEEGFYRVTEVDDWADKYTPDSPATTQFFVGRDGTNGDAVFYYVNNWYDQNGTGLVDDEVTDDVHQFDFTTKTLTQYPWIGDVAVARNHVIGLD